MGIVIESCKSTIKCCDSDDERGYKRTYPSNMESDSDNNNDESASEPDYSTNEKKEEAPQDVKNMKIGANNLFMQRHISPWKFYEEVGELGIGNYGVVKKVRLIKNPTVVRAMKIIPEENIIQGEGASLIDEIEILKNLEHPNIMKIYESFVFDNNYYIVSELCDQGHLLSKMEKLEKMDQIVVKFLMEQIFNAVAYLHSKNILHGDIKLENVLLYTASKRGGRRFTCINQDFNQDKSLTEDINQNFGKKKFSKKGKNYIRDMMNYEIKLIDFGCSKYFVKKNKKKKLSGIIGTSIYCSPEVVDNLYDEKSDEWSCGVLMYILLCGQPPFYGDNEDEIFEKIKKCEYDFSNPAFKNVSKNCKDLIRKLLEPKKQHRIKASDALKHPFFTESFDPSSAMTENKDLNMLKQFVNPITYCSKFHEAIIAFLSVNFITVDEENNLRTLFRYMDKDGKNAITKEEMKKCLEEININISDEELQKVFETVDNNGTGYIEYQEFIRNACDIKQLLTESNLKNVFLTISGNKETINGEDIKNFIFHDTTVHEDTLKEYFEQFGMKYDDTMIFEEFYHMIKKNKKLRRRANNKKDKINRLKEPKSKLKESKYAFKGPVINEEKGEEEIEDEEEKNNDKNGDNQSNEGDDEEDSQENSQEESEEQSEEQSEEPSEEPSEEAKEETKEENEEKKDNEENKENKENKDKDEKEIKS